MKILTLLLTFALAFPAWAEELEHFPGWKINKIEKEESEDGSISSGPEYYGLTPPDERPPVSIDARTARALKAGESQPEEVYGKIAGKNGKSESATASASGDSYEYSAGNNGFVQADAINSTLPGYAAEPMAARALHKRGGDSFGAGDTASYGGAGASMAGGSSSYGGTAGSDYASSGAAGGSAGYSGANGSYGAGAAGAVNGGFKSAAGAASPAAAQANVKAQQLAANGAGGNVPGSLASNGLNVKSGFDAVNSDGKTGSTGSGGKGRTPASYDEEAPPPPCDKARFVYDKSTHARVKLPVGCGLIHISAWGAGGGSGLQIYQSGGRDDSGTQSVREIPGGGASFMSTVWEIDARKYDLIVVVGEPGGKAKQKTTTVQDNSNDGGGTRTVITLEGGDGGGPEGKDGGTGGGGGGGYSGVFLVPKTDSSITLNKSRAMAIAAGGKGGGSGGAGGAGSVPSSAPDARMTNQIGEKGNGTKAGFHYYFERNGAGSPGNGGKVILEYY
jgi:hypothetical protein